MGAFFTNVHVSVPNVDRPRAERILRDRISRAVLAGPFREAAAGEPSDRTVVIVPDDAPGWYVIYDEETEGMDPRELEGLAAPLSLEPAVASISALVADSDQFELRLYKEGKRADRIAVGELGRVASKGGRQKRSLGKTAWGGLLTKRQMAEADRALRSSSAFAEESLQTFAKLLAWNQDLAHLGFSHADEIDTRERVELRFCLRAEAEKWIRFREGPPLLRSGQTEKAVILKAGQPLDWFFATIYNEGGAGQGLAVVIPWSAETATLLDIRALRLTAGERTTLEVPFERVEGGSVSGLRVTLEELPLPAWPEWVGPESAFNLPRFNHVLQRGRLWPSLTGTALRAGKVDLSVVYVPLGNPEKGSAVILYHVEVSEPEN